MSFSQNKKREKKNTKLSHALLWAQGGVTGFSWDLVASGKKMEEVMRSSPPVVSSICSLKTFLYCLLSTCFAIFIRSASAWREIVWINRCLIVYLQVGHVFFRRWRRCARGWRDLADARANVTFQFYSNWKLQNLPCVVVRTEPPNCDPRGREPTKLKSWQPRIC